jgi:hypothetical protein
MTDPGFEKYGVALISGDLSSGDDTSEDVDGCIGSAIEGVSPKLHIMMPKQFREGLFPYFMPSTTPQSPQGLKDLMQKLIVQKRLASLNVRYLVFLLKKPTVTDRHGGIGCFAGPGAGGCLGLSWWDRKSDLKAEVWDLSSGDFLGKVSAQAYGTGVLPALMIPIPLYVPATDATACKDIGRYLGRALTGIIANKD